MKVKKVIPINLASPPEFPTEKTVLDFSVKDVEVFGSDNLFPQAISILNRRSPKHRGILNSKTIYTMGQQFTSEDQKLTEYIKEVNNNNESLRKVFKKLLFDGFAYGNSYIEIVTDRQRRFLWLYHKDATKARVGKDKKKGYIVFHPDWTKYDTYKKYAIQIPIYPNFEKGDDGLMHSIIHFKDYEPEFTHYGIPGWVSAMDAAGIAYKTNKWNISRLENSFQTSGVMIVEGQMSDDDAEQMERDMAENMTGEGKQGRVLFIIKQLGQGTTDGSKYIPISKSEEGDWLQLHRQSDEDLITAHSWFRSLTAIEDSTGFDTNRIRNEFELALQTVITDMQEFYLETLRRLFDEANLGTSLSVINKMPISIADLINVNRVTRIWEGRKALGLEYDPEAEEEREYIDNGTSPNIKING